MLATVNISVVEYLYRSCPDVGTALLRAAPFILVAQASLYYVFHYAPSLMAAWIVFAVTMSLMRVLNSFIFLNEGLSLPWILLASVLMTLSGVAIKLSHGDA